MPLGLVMLNTIRHRLDSLISTTQKQIHKYRTSTRFRRDDYVAYLSFFLEQLRAYQNHFYFEPPSFIEQFPERDNPNYRNRRIEIVTTEKSKDRIVEIVAEEIDDETGRLRSFALFVKNSEDPTLISRKGDPRDGPMQRVLQLAMDYDTRIIWVDEVDNPINASLRLIQPTRSIGRMLYSLSRHIRMEGQPPTPDNIEWQMVSQEIMTVVEIYERENLIPLKTEVN
jgi:hypothetical protein